MNVAHRMLLIQTQFQLLCGQLGVVACLIYLVIYRILAFLLLLASSEIEHREYCAGHVTMRSHAELS